MATDKSDMGSSLMKVVEAISISPDDAREVVVDYESQAKASFPAAGSHEIRDIVVDAIIRRYARLAAVSGGATALTGVVPGIGTAISTLGGGLVDVSTCMKWQIDMTMCLALAFNKRLTNEDAKHMSYIIALTGAIEKMASGGATRIGSKACVRMLNQHLKGATLQWIKALFKQFGLTFTKRAAAKAIPFGVGAIISGGTNYALTQYVGRTARDILAIDAGEKSVFGGAATA